MVLLFKSGSTKMINNYRPISLLNTITKMFAAILKKRIAHKIDKYLHKTQYGFRSNKSTQQAIHIIRRLIELGERKSSDKRTTREYNIHLLALDWEKAFDKVNQTALFEAMERMGIDEKLIKLTKQLYKNPTLKVEMGNQSSEWKEQKTGIRQGCPLSPYLFRFLMTMMFHD